MTSWTRLAAFALAVSVTHHLGILTASSGTVGPLTGYDLVDLLTPYAVVGAALLVLVSVGTDRTGWLLTAVGALAYVQGHGLHLAANSISNETERGALLPSDATHLWDEVIGHYVWYAGLALLVVVLARRLAAEPSPRGPIPALLAIAVGLTWATNALEGGTAVASMLVAIGLAVWGLRTRRTAGRLLIWAYAPAVALLAGWGISYAGFPQPSSL